MTLDKIEGLSILIQHAKLLLVHIRSSNLIPIYVHAHVREHIVTRI